MKTKYLFLSFVFAAFLTSSMPFGSHALEEGKEAPLLSFSSGSSRQLLDSLKGKYVIVNFWSSKDPKSRIDNKQIADLASSLPQSKIRMVSICTDSDKSLQPEISYIDGIPDSTISLSASDISPEVLDDYQTSTGNRSFLIDPYGNLLSISPTLQEISSVIS